MHIKTQCSKQMLHYLLIKEINLLQLFSSEISFQLFLFYVYFLVFKISLTFKISTKRKEILMSSRKHIRLCSWQLQNSCLTSCCKFILTVVLKDTLI